MSDAAAIELDRPRLSRGNTRVVHKVGPHSRPHRLAKIDGRTREATLMRQVREDLTRHCGGKPSVVQRAMIERVVWLSLRLAQLDRKIADGKNFTEIDSNTYLAWNNSFIRTLAKLGIESKVNGSRPSVRGLSGISCAAGRFN